MLIKNKQELLDMVGARDGGHLQKILFRETDCGIVAGFSQEKIKEENITYVLKLKPTKLLAGKEDRIAWEITHYHRADTPLLSHRDTPMPYGVGEYLLAYPPAGINAPQHPAAGSASFLGGDTFKETWGVEEFSWGTRKEAQDGLKALKDSRISRITFRGKNAYLTIKIPEKIYGPVFFAGGYCEGCDWEIETHYLPFPMTEKMFWETVTKADKEGVEMWRQTHGCEKCFPGGTCDEWGNAFNGGESGGPIDPDCSNCQGDGIVL